MCGIAGFNFKVNDKSILNSLHHRGPDEQSKWSDNTISLFHTRLSIQDISGGHQPFCYQNYIIIFNGEIYNHFELRKELIEFNFQTKSDTETLLYLYIKYKEDMFKNIDGMFAFAIYDKNKKTLFLARDRAGKKPLYIYQKGKNFGFASEINAFKNLDLTIDEEDIKLYLNMGFCESGYNEVKEFPAGSFGKLKIENTEFKIEKYFDILDYYKKDKINNHEAFSLVENALKKSVTNRLFSSDFDVGAFLSGGIDSSLIVAKASEHKKVNTYTIKFKGAFDESKLAKLVANKYGTNHTEIEINIDNLKFDIANIIKSYGKPFFDSSAIPSFYVSKEARNYQKVILNGDGADEFFGGYRRYVGVKHINFFKLFNFLNINGDNRGIKLFLNRIFRASKADGIKWYNILLNDLFNLNGNKINEFDDFIKNIDLDPLSKIMYLDFIWNLRYGLLIKMDIATMQNSLEGRSPFLSKYFLELSPRIDNNLKIKGLTTKYILRELAKKYLPKELVYAKKRGFEIPLVKWVNEDLKEVIMDYLSNGFYLNFLDKKEILDIIERKIKISETKRAKILYLLFALEVWDT